MLVNKYKVTKWGSLLLLSVVTLLLLGYYLRTELRIMGGELGVPLDDAWIHFQFARNISQGHGFSYNPGEPTPGSTAPLWTLMLAAVGWFSTDFLRPALAMSALFLLLSVWLAYGFTRWITHSTWAAFLAGLGVALTGRLLWAGLAGMETTAFAALSLAAIWAYSKWGLRVFTALLFALAGQLRPEGHALFALAVANAGWSWWRVNQRIHEGRWHSLARQFAPPLIAYILIAAPYSLFSLSTTGRWLPNTFYAKAGSEHLFSWRTLQETVAWQWQDNPLSILLLLLGIWPLWKRSRLSVLWLLGLPLFTAVVIDFTWHHGRYTMPLIPLQMVAAATGAHWLVQKLTGEQGVIKVSWLRTALPILLTLLLLLGGAWRLPQWAMMLGNNTREVQDIDVALGDWLAENTDPNALIAVDDIGAIAYLSGRRIVDMNGLVSPQVWPAIREQEGLARNQVLTRILSQSRADYMAAFPLWRWDIATNPTVAQVLHQVNTDTHTIVFQQDAFVYEMVWPYVAEAHPDQTINATFGDGINLLGYDVTAVDPLQIILYWQSETSVTDSYDIFLHIMDESGEIVTQVDQKPVGGLVATEVWQEGDIIRDPLSIPLPSDLPPGTYELHLGVYLRETGERLPVSGGESANNALHLARLSLP